MTTHFRSFCMIPAMLCVLVSGFAQTQTLYFSSNEYALTNDMQTLLDLQLQAYKLSPNISITGHTDADGSDAYNLSLGEKRASSIKAYLVSKGVDPRTIETYSSGESKPVGDNQTAAGKVANRRVEIEVHWVAEPEKMLKEQSVIQVEKPTQFLESFRVKPIYKTIDPTKANDVAIGDKGTVLHIPANAFVDEKGNVIKDHVKLAFTEYKNAADMAFAEIPMTYHNGGEEMCFSSAGMFSLTGTANNQEIYISESKEIEVDYALAKQQDDIAFFSLNADDQWTKVEDIAKMKIDTLYYGVKDDSLVLLDPKQRNSDFGFRIRKFNGAMIEDTDVILWDPKADTQQFPKYVPDPGHTYPDVVRGLSVKGFGVYNCDQIYRIDNKVRIKPVFVDIEGNKIDDGSVLSLIDLKYNGAFSFDPAGYINLNQKGRNVLLLITKSDKMYLISEKDMYGQKLINNAEHVFTMEEVTEQLNTSNKLAEYLGLD